MDTTKKTSKPGYEIAEADVQIYLKDELGEGGFGKVFKGTWLGDEVALKVLLTRIEGDMEAMFRREIEIMLKLQGCPRLVRLLGAVMEGQPSDGDGVDVKWQLAQFIAQGKGSRLGHQVSHSVGCGVRDKVFA